MGSMKNLYWFKEISNNVRSGRRLSLGEYKRAVSWSKYLISSGAAIKGEGEEEWSADLSQLFIGSKFASGRHSRIYRGIYKHMDVAIKLVSQPEEDEELAVLLEKQFTSEVALLFRLRHPNIITVSPVFPTKYLYFCTEHTNFHLHPLSCIPFNCFYYQRLKE